MLEKYRSTVYVSMYVYTKGCMFESQCSTFCELFHLDIHAHVIVGNLVKP